MKKLPIVILISVILLAISFFTVLDSEWRNGKVLNEVRGIFQKLYSYKRVNGKYPTNLEEVAINQRYCLLTFCYTLVYKPSDDLQTLVIVTKANDPFIVYLSSTCPNAPEVTEENASACASFAFKEDYQGNRTDFPIYRKNRIFDADPSTWPESEQLQTIMRKFY